MTLLELKKLIDTHLKDRPHHENDIVCIPNNKPNAVGGLPTTNLQAVGSGFDWDSGKFMLYPEKNMIEMKLKDTLENL